MYVDRSIVHKIRLLNGDPQQQVPIEWFGFYRPNILLFLALYIQKKAPSFIL